MDGVTLLAEARAAGLKVSLSESGDRLVIKGPLRLEAVAQRLIAAKPEVVTALRYENAAPPSWLCPMCNGFVFWRYDQGPFICNQCHPCPCPDRVVEEITIATALPPELTALLEKHGWDTSPPVRWPQTRQRPALPGDDDDFDDE